MALLPLEATNMPESQIRQAKDSHSPKTNREKKGKKERGSWRLPDAAWSRRRLVDWAGDQRDSGGSESCCCKIMLHQVIIRELGFRQMLGDEKIGEKTGKEEKGRESRREEERRERYQRERRGGGLQQQ